MSKKSIIIVLIISFILSCICFYRLVTISDKLSVERTVYYSLLLLIFVNLLYIGYKNIVEKTIKENFNPLEFVQLDELESKVVCGIVQFYFTCSVAREATFSILNKEMKQVEIVEQKEYSKGGNIVTFDTSKLPSEQYFYCITTDNQTNMKKFWVNHDKLSEN